MNTGTKIRKQDNPKLTHNQNIRGKIRICGKEKINIKLLQQTAV